LQRIAFGLISVVFSYRPDCDNRDTSANPDIMNSVGSGVVCNSMGSQTLAVLKGLNSQQLHSILRMETGITVKYITDIALTIQERDQREVGKFTRSDSHSLCSQLPFMSPLF
jgi:hypothetical protein